MRDSACRWFSVNPNMTELFDGSSFGGGQFDSPFISQEELA